MPLVSLKRCPDNMTDMLQYQFEKIGVKFLTPVLMELPESFGGHVYTTNDGNASTIYSNKVHEIRIYDSTKLYTQRKVEDEYTLTLTNSKFR